MGDKLSREDIINTIRLLSAALNYPEELDTPDEDVVRWENEGGSPQHMPLV